MPHSSDSSLPHMYFTLQLLNGRDTIISTIWTTVTHYRRFAILGAAAADQESKHAHCIAGEFSNFSHRFLLLWQAFPLLNEGPCNNTFEAYRDSCRLRRGT